MNRRLLAFVALAVVLAALFVRLGVWQLERRGERRSANARVASRLALPSSMLVALAPGPDAAPRRAIVEGEPDFEHEFVVTGRSRNGSPGVHIITPVRVAGRDTAVLVNRGWVYAADAATVDLDRWREPGTRRFTGYTQLVPGGGAIAAVRGRGLRPLSLEGVQRLVPYPVAALYLVSRDAAAETAPVRLEPPALDEGAHLSYAIQWFCFAAIALVGTAVVVTRARRERLGGSTGA